MSPRPDRRQLLAGAAAAAAAWPLEASLPAAGGGRETLRMVYLTDVHARVEWDTPRALELAATAINRTAPDLVVAGGDLITDGFDGTAEETGPRWDVYLEMHRAITAPVVAAIGNHDLVGAGGPEPQADPRAAFRKRLGVERTYRSLDAAGLHLVLLDPIEPTDDDLRYHGRVGRDQLRWLAADLERVDPGTPVVAVCHMPLLTAFYQATEGATAPAPLNRVVGNSREVLAAFEGRRLPLVLQGHLHVDEMLRWRDTTFLTGGALCGKWWRKGDWHGTGPGFGVLTFRPDRVDWEYRGFGWEPRRP